jgi:MYXO-CTERM domain-containing protein
VDVGSDGALYVADYFTPRILVYPRAGTTPSRVLTTTVMLADNLSRAPGTDLLMVATNSGTFALYRESGVLVSGPSFLGMDIILGAHTRSNSAGSDGLTFIGTSGRLWFCDHNPPLVSCYLHTRACTGPADCPLPFIGCDIPSGQCLSATCGDGRVQGGEECDDGDTMSGDGCSAGCVVEPGFVCNGEPSVCGTCTDDTPFMVDTGCVPARPHCRTTGPRAPACEVCIDSSPDLGDLGCTPAAPFCIRTVTGVNACVECNVDVDCDDRVECTTDTCSRNVCSHTSRPAGEVCSIGVCGGPGDDRCVECVSDAQCSPGFVCHPGRFCMPVFTDAGMALPDAFFELPDAFFELPDATLPGPDAATPPRDAGRSDAGPATPDAGMDAGSGVDAGPLGGSFVGGAVCSASSTPTRSRATWAIVLAALGLVLSRRRSSRR